MYQGKNFSRFLDTKDIVDDNSSKDPMVHNGADVSIGTQPEEERMQGDQFVEITDYFKAQLQRNYEFQDKGSEAML